MWWFRLSLLLCNGYHGMKCEWILWYFHFHLAYFPYYCYHQYFYHNILTTFSYLEEHSSRLLGYWCSNLSPHNWKKMQFNTSFIAVNSNDENFDPRVRNLLSSSIMPFLVLFTFVFHLWKVMELALCLDDFSVCPLCLLVAYLLSLCKVRLQLVVSHLFAVPILVLWVGLK